MMSVVCQNSHLQVVAADSCNGGEDDAEDDADSYQTKLCKHVLQWVRPCKDPASAWSWVFANPNDGKYYWTSVNEREPVVCILHATERNL